MPGPPGIRITVSLSAPRRFRAALFPGSDARCGWAVIYVNEAGLLLGRLGCQVGVGARDRGARRRGQKRT